MTQWTRGRLCDTSCLLLPCRANMSGWLPLAKTDVYDKLRATAISYLLNLPCIQTIHSMLTAIIMMGIASSLRKSWLLPQMLRRCRDFWPVPALVKNKTKRVALCTQRPPMACAVLANPGCTEFVSMAGRSLFYMALQSQSVRQYLSPPLNIRQSHQIPRGYCASSARSGGAHLGVDRNYRCLR